MGIKKQFKFFTIFEYEQEQEYLRDMHKSGWEFILVTGFCIYHFKKCTPEDVVYQLDYNKDRLEHREEYLQMFSDMGWEYIQDYVGYSYFRKPVSQGGVAEEIFCDDESRLQMMGRVFRGRMVPMLVIFFCLLMPQFFINISGRNNLFVTVLIGVAVAIVIFVFTNFAVKYWQYKNRA
ncbi:MAG: DUF2812 domain-containing protein [Clostridiales bacterium]|jgi:hypothetical protein|nr:DUF2812 domain-containing protein [Clostridiales bacterium]